MHVFAAGIVEFDPSLHWPKRYQHSLIALAMGALFAKPMKPSAEVPRMRSLLVVRDWTMFDVRPRALCNCVMRLVWTQDIQCMMQVILVPLH